MKKKSEIGAIVEAYRKYTAAGRKKELNARILENDRWYKQEQDEYASSEDRKKGAGQPKSRSGYLFSAIANKHADAMDNYPDINILPREQGDKDEAQRLTAILPCVLELCNFKDVYAQNWWYKLKNGTAVYGVFWNGSLQNGLGDIEIKKVDILNLAWQPGITDIQESRYVFYSYYMDKEAFVKKYGKQKLSQADNTFELDTYGEKEFAWQEESVLVADCYYKDDGKVYLVKFSGEQVLEQSDGPLYEHGLYPFVFDVMYPNEGTPVGFGVIDVTKGTQAYIDKLDALLTENSAIVGKTRYFVRDQGGVNEDEFRNLDNPFVHVAGTLDERNIVPIEGKALPTQLGTQREQKINELKEVIGNRDFQQGGTSGGVTAASAITVLQQAGDKLSRDIIGASYRAYKQIVNLCIELIRQFYDLERSFRITGEGGEEEFIQYNNSGLQMQSVGMAAAGDGPDSALAAALRKPEFDVSLSVQKSNPFTKELQNQTIMQLWGAGMFNPQILDLSLIALEFMQFEGKDEMVAKLSEYSQMQKQMQQMQTALKQMQAAQMQQAQPMHGQADGGAGQNLVAVPKEELGGMEHGVLG